MKNKMLLLLAALGLAGAKALALPFTSGNLVIYRVGDGTTALSNAATGIDILEVTPLGSVVQTLAIPTTGTDRLTASGTATSDGKLRANGEYLAIPGYNSALGTAGVASTTDPRRVLVMDKDGQISANFTFPGGAGSPYGGNNIRGAIPNDTGTGAWTAGHEGTTGTPNGVYSIDGSSSTQLVSANLRTVEIYDGQLYSSTAAGSGTRVQTVGTGLPTTAGQSFADQTGLPTTGSNYGSFQLFDLNAGVTGLDTMYLVNGLNLEKWSYNGAAWSLNNSVASSASFMDITGFASGGTVSLFAVTATDLFSLTDSGGHNANNNGTLSSSLLAAGSNYAFRGVEFAPIPEPGTYVLVGVAGLAAYLLRRRKK